MRLVILEDDPSIGASMQAALEGQGYEVAWYVTAAEANTELEERPPDLVLLDVGLPDVDGLTLCRWLRDTHPDLPIVLVTARDSDIDIVVGLDAGATDYVTKPFAMNVLLARVRAHLRSTEAHDVGAPIAIGPLVIEPAAYRASIDGDDVGLRKREFELLILLAREAGRVVTRERLLSEVWDLHWDSPSKTLEMHVLALRRKLGDAVEITTVRGVGYRLDRP
jgi:DNA-binding response OmpR family regulator